MKFIKATCPSCGASLELADHLQSANCPNCGSKILIEWETKQNPAAYLELAKRFIESKNYKEADEQLTRVLEMKPGNKEAWFWKWIVLRLSQMAEFGDKHAYRQKDKYLQTSANPDDYFEKAAYSDVEIAERLLGVPEFPVGHPHWCRHIVQATTQNPELADKLWAICTGEEIEKWFFYFDRHDGYLFEAQEIALRAKQIPVSHQKVRQDRLKALGDALTGISKGNHHEHPVIVRNAHRLFELVATNQPDDWLEVYMFEKDWLGNEKLKPVRQRLSYWRKWLEQRS